MAATGIWQAWWGSLPVASTGKSSRGPSARRSSSRIATHTRSDRPGRCLTRLTNITSTTMVRCRNILSPLSLSTALGAASTASQPHATSQSLSSAVPDETKPRRGDQRFGDYRAFRLAEKAWYERRRRERLKTSRAPYSTNASRRRAGIIAASSVVPAAKDDTVLPLPDPPSWWWPLPRPHTPSWLSPPLPSSTSREQMLSRRAAQEQRRQEEEKRGRVETEILAMPPLAPELTMSGAGDVDNAASQTQMQAELARPMRWCTRVPTTS